LDTRIYYLLSLPHPVTQHRLKINPRIVSRQSRA
jgi:hypothetical protein